jgi:hypothetical protein
MSRPEGIDFAGATAEPERPRGPGPDATADQWGRCGLPGLSEREHNQNGRRQERALPDPPVHRISHLDSNHCNLSGPPTGLVLPSTTTCR